MNQELKKIKKLYGESMAKFCRESFSTLLEEEGLLVKLLTENFAESHFLFNDIVNNRLKQEFKKYIYGLVSYEPEEIKVDKTPEELMSEAGYDLYECKTEKDIQSFKRYYAPGEELCTFNGGRLDSCRVFFAIKKDVEKIKRENFTKPERQDEYGTSVISIQFTRGSYTLSIKNRYNHTVNNCDATFSNNLDNIIPGLTKSFEKYYGIIQLHKSTGFEIPNYVFVEGKYYKYNYEMNNIYYCPNNIIIDNFEAIRYEKEKYIVLDCFILDLVNKNIYLYDFRAGDSFPDTIEKIRNIVIENIQDGKKIKITPEQGEEIIININKKGCITGYKNNNVNELKTHFLADNESLKELEMINVEKIGSYVLSANQELTEINFPNLITVEDNFLINNQSIEKIFMPKLESVGHWFLFNNDSLKEVCLPELRSVDSCFMTGNNSIKKINFPKLIEVGSSFFMKNRVLEQANLPKLEKAGSSFLRYNLKLEYISLPSLLEMGSSFMEENRILSQIELPKLKVFGASSLYWNQMLKTIDLPNIEEIQIGVLYTNPNLKLPVLERRKK